MLLCGLLCAGLATGCASEAPASVFEQHDRYPDVVELPEPDITGTMTLEKALSDRRSTRTFSSEELGVETIGQLFWAGQGVTHEGGYRTAPSAGALYPLQLYAVTQDRVIRYRPETHDAASRADSSTLQELPALAFDQEFIAAAPLVVLVTGTATRTETKYGAKAEAFVDREAGHAAQNIILQATALGLNSVAVGGFEEGTIEPLLLLPPGERVLYLIPIGLPDQVG